MSGVPPGIALLVESGKLILIGVSLSAEIQNRVSS